MGTICAPSYANIFMASFEAKHIYPYIKEMFLLCLGYIDDLLVIWKDAKAELMTSIKELNKRHKTVKFDFQISSRKIAIFDLMLYEDQNINIQTTLYRKPADQQAFLHAKSEHPRPLKSSIPYSQALRLKQFALQLQNSIRIILSLSRSFQTGNIKKEFQMSKSRKLIERIERKELFSGKKKNK